MAFTCNSPRIPSNFAKVIGPLQENLSIRSREYTDTTKRMWWDRDTVMALLWLPAMELLGAE